MKFFLSFLLLIASTIHAQKSSIQATKNVTSILPGAYQLQEYLPLLKHKRVGIFANHTATIGHTHLVDTLRSLGITITKAFGPEHGFRGTTPDGVKVDDYIDPATNIPVISLYGKKRKPSATDLADVDVMLFDIQDVGTRFYTFISSLQEFIESAIEYDKPLIILDRPNPNGFYVDGPVLDTLYKSFVGMQPVPIVYGMTIGEYAKMLLGEKMLDWKYIRKQDNKTSLGEMLGFEQERTNFKLTVIKCRNYTHKSKYVLPVKPSPNLPDMSTVYWYASNCLFEGTVLSEGRGTDHPFCTIGHPNLPDSLYRFKPMPRDGAVDPKHKNKTCYGWNVYDTPDAVLKTLHGHLQLSLLLKAYALFPQKDSFFITPKSKQPTDYFFNKLAGNDELMEQIKAGKSEAEIRKSWQPKLAAFKKIRKKYLLYKDFE